MPAQPLMPPSAESLLMSASTFHGQIQSWIPADFGLDQASSSKPNTGLTDSFQTDFERSERLGLGHPSLLVSAKERRAEASGSAAGAGNAALERMLKRAKGKEREGNITGAGKEEEEDEEEEGESRGRIGKKRKIERVDMLLGKKKAKAKKMPTFAKVTTPPPQTATTDTANPDPPASATDKDENEEVTAAADDAGDMKSRSRTDGDNQANFASPALTPGPGASLLTKNQRKKMKKKQKKLAQGGPL